MHKDKFSLSPSVRSGLLTSERPLTVTEIAGNLNRFIDAERTQKMTGAAINAWLLEIGLLETVKLSNGKERKAPTKQGNEMGIFVDERNGQFGQYYVVLFTSEAQQLIYDNIEAIAERKK